MTNISPSLWGPGAWTFIHYIALAYPENPSQEDKENYKNFFINLQNVLPCQNCSDNYKQNLQKYSLDQALTNTQSLFQWTVNVHNEVNNETNKRNYSYEEAFKLYAETGTDYNDLIFKIGCVLLIILVGLFIYKKI